MKRSAPFFFLFLFLLISITHPQTNASPSWMKTGAYAEYQFNSTGVAFYNTTFIEFKDNTTCTFRWECTKIQNQMATLNISMSFSGKKGFTLYETVYVNTFSREVFSTNGTFIGATFLWGPTTITDGQKIILWNKPPDKIEGTATIIGISGTPQGLQKAYTIEAQGSISGKEVQIVRFYDFNTGVCIDGYVTDDILLTVTGLIYFGLNGSFDFKQTNIDLGAAEQISASTKEVNTTNEQLDLEPIFIALLLFIASFALSVAMYQKRKKQYKYRHKK